MKRPLLRLSVFSAICFTCLLVLNPTASAQEEENNQWSYFEGNKTFNAAFVRLEGDKAVFRSLSTAQEAAIPLKSLSMESHLRVLKLSKPEAFSKPLTKAPPKLEKVELAKPVASQPVSELLRSPFKPNGSIEDFLQTAKVELDKGNIMVAWHALPTEIQKKLDSLVAKSAQKLGDKTLGQIRSVMGSVDTIFQEKGQFVFDHPKVKELGVSDKVKKVWPIVAGIVHAFTAEEKWQMESFQEGKIAEWVAKMGGDLSGYQPLLESAMQETGLVPPGSENATFEYKILSQSKGRAEVELSFVVPNAPAPPPMTLKFQKYKGIWLVPSFMNALEDRLDEVHTMVDNGAIDSKAISAVLGLSIRPPIRALATAKTQEDFNEAIDPIIELLEQGAAMQGQMGPGGAGGPGGFGPPPGL